MKTVCSGEGGRGGGSSVEVFVVRDIHMIMRQEAPRRPRPAHHVMRGEEGSGGYIVEAARVGG